MTQKGSQPARLTFEVTDDVVGFEPGTSAYGTGLQGVADRLAAIDGPLEGQIKAWVGDNQPRHRADPEIK
jgi:glucose-6-phosphate-specific signal transduction histidine kinase